MIAQIDLVTGILNLIARHGNPELNCRQINAITDAADSIMVQLMKPTVPPSDGMGLRAWLMSDATGMSSLYMASILCVHPLEPRTLWMPIKYNHPYDSADFGRCYRFLSAVPVGAPDDADRRQYELARMAGRSRYWDSILSNWTRLCYMYDKKEFMLLTALLGELRKETGTSEK